MSAENKSRGRQIRVDEKAERAQLPMDILQRMEDLALINALNDAVNRGESLEAILILLAKGIRHIFDSITATVYLLSEDGKYLVMQKYIPRLTLEKKIEKLIKIPIPQITLPLQAAKLFQDVLRTGKPMLINSVEGIHQYIATFIEDVHIPKRSRPWLRKLIPQIQQIIGAQSVVIAPLLSKEGPIGQMDFACREPFTEENLKRVEVIAGQVTGALRRKQVEEALRATEAKYRTLVEQAPAAVYTDAVDEASTTIYMSPQVETISGYSPEEWVANPDLWIKLIYPDDRSRVEEEHLRTNKTGEPFKIEYRLSARDGRVVWVRDEAMLIRDEAGRPLFWQGIMLDITERKQAEGMQRAYIQRIMKQQRVIAWLAREGVALASDFRSAVQAITQAVAEAMDVERVSIWLLNEDHSELRCVDLYEKRPAAHSEGLVLRVRDYPRYFKTLETERVIDASDAHKDPRTREFRKKYLIPLGISSMLDAIIRVSGKVVGVVCHEHVGVLRAWQVEEVTFAGEVADQAAQALMIVERKQTTEALRESQQMLRTILDTIPVRVFWKDKDSNYLGCNWPFASDSGLKSPEELLGKNDFFMGWAEQAELYRADDRHVIETGESKLNYEEPQTTPSGEKIWLRTSKVPLINPDGQIKGILGTYEDITEQKRTDEAQKRQLRELTILHAVAVAVAQAGSVNELIEGVTQAIGNALYPDNFGIMFLDDASGTLRHHTSYRDGINVDTPEVIPLSQGVTGYVASTGRPYRVADVSQEPRYLEVTSDTRSELCVPIKVGERVIGVINTESTQLDFFSEADERLLMTVSGQLATALEKMRLFEAERQRRHEAETLRDATAALTSSLNLELILNNLLDRLAEVIPYDSAAVFFQEDDHLRVVAGRGFPKPERVIGQQFWAKDALFDIISQTRRPLILSDARADPRFLAWGDADDVRGWMGVPLIARNEVIGRLTIDSRTPDTYKESQAELAMAFANQAATAIVNARLYQEALRDVERRAILHRVSQDMAHISQDPEQTYSAIYQATKELMPCDAFVIALCDEGRQENVFVYMVERDQHWPVEYQPLGRGLTGRVISSGEVIIIDDLAPDDPSAIRFGSAQKVRSILAVALRVGDRIIGMISAQCYQPQAYRDEEKRLLEMLAAHAATAIENTRLYAETNHRMAELEALVQTSEALTASLELQPLLENILTSACRVIPAAEKGTIMLRDPDQALRIRVMTGYTDACLPALLFSDETGYAARAVREKRAILVQDAHTEYRIPQHDQIAEVDAIQSAISAPLIAEENVIGVISLDNATRKAAFTEVDLRLLTVFASSSALAIERVRLFEQAQRHASEYGALYEIARDLSAQTDLQTMLRTITERTAVLLGAPGSAIYLFDVERGDLDVMTATTPGVVGRRLAIGEGMAGRVAQTHAPLIVNDYPAWETPSPMYEDVPFTSVLEVPMLYGGDLIGVLSVYHLASDDTTVPERQFTQSDANLLSLGANAAAGAVYSARLLEQTRRYADRLARVNALGRALTTTLDLLAIYRSACEHVQQIFDCPNFVISLFDEAKQVIIATYVAIDGKELDASLFSPQPYDADETATGRAKVIATAQSEVIDDLTTQSYREKSLFIGDGCEPQSAIYTPMVVEGKVIGLLNLQSYKKHAYSKEDGELLSMIANQIGLAIQNARLFMQTEQRLQRLSTLHAIDLAISASVDLHVTLKILLEHVIGQLHVDAADILLLHVHMQTLEYATGQGFRTRNVERISQRLGEGLAGYAALQRERVALPDLAHPSFTTPASPKELIPGEDFQSYFAVPLISKGWVQGVLEIFHRTPLEPDVEWLNFLDTLAGQAAVAIDNALLFEKLQRSTVELTLAYNATIEGWSYALDLRDKETEGHTQRVADITLRLAQEMGIKEVEMNHVYRGALLHDIGKMGVPDSILNKSDTLTHHEWETMHQHPRYAYDMLSPIAYLRPALDIPYCHHEKWDGSGYPRGLKAEQIPLSARIFAVVDVYDALVSDRPYRKAWSREKAIAYLHEQAGMHFDPKVVDTFLRVLKQT